MSASKQAQFLSDARSGHSERLTQKVIPLPNNIRKMLLSQCCFKSAALFTHNDNVNCHLFSLKSFMIVLCELPKATEEYFTSLMILINVQLFVELFISLKNTGANER